MSLPPVVRLLGWLALLMLQGPLVYTVWVSFSPDMLLTPPVADWSTRWYAAFMEDPQWSRAAIRSLVTGVLVTSAGPHSGDPKVVKRFGVLDDAAYVHFRAVVALLIVAVIVGWLIRGRRADRSLMVPAMWFIPFFIAQVVIGEVQWRNQLPWQVVLAHVTVAGVVWALGSAIAWRLARPITSRAAD